MCAVMAALLLSELQAIGWRLHSVVQAERGAPSGPFGLRAKDGWVLPACVIRVPSALQLKTRGKPSVAPQAERSINRTIKAVQQLPNPGNRPSVAAMDHVCFKVPHSIAA